MLSRVTFGLVTDVPEPGASSPEDMPEDGHSAQFQPVAAHSLSASHPAPLPGTNHIATSISDAPKAIDGDVAERFAKDQKRIVAAAPSVFQEFLLHQAELMETLKDTVPTELLEAAATKGALRVTKLQSADVHQAIAAMREAKGQLQQAGTSKIQGWRAEQIDTPTREIAQTQKTIAGFVSQIEGLQSQIDNLRASIQPATEKISHAKADIDQAEQVFQTAQDQLEAYLAKYEQDLISQLTPAK